MGYFWHQIHGTNENFQSDMPEKMYSFWQMKENLLIYICFIKCKGLLLLCFRENYIKAWTTSWAKRFAKDINFDDYIIYSKGLTWHIHVWRKHLKILAMSFQFLYFFQSGAKINISDGSCPERIVTVTGHTDSIYKAFTLICNKFEEVSKSVHPLYILFDSFGKRKLNIDIAALFLNNKMNGTIWINYLIRILPRWRSRKAT